jgi:hypothetical protein
VGQSKVQLIRYSARRVSPGSISFSNTLPEVLLSLLHMVEVEHPEQTRLGDLNTHGKVIDTFQAATGLF